MKELLQSCCEPPSASNFHTSITQPMAGDGFIVSKLLNLKLHGRTTGGGKEALLGMIVWEC